MKGPPAPTKAPSSSARIVRREDDVLVPCTNELKLIPQFDREAFGARKKSSRTTQRHTRKDSSYLLLHNTRQRPPHERWFGTGDTLSFSVLRSPGVYAPRALFSALRLIFFGCNEKLLRKKFISEDKALRIINDPPRLLPFLEHASFDAHISLRR